MSSRPRKTYDTDVITLRSIFANNPGTNTPISSGYVLVVGTNGNSSFIDPINIPIISSLSTAIGNGGGGGSGDVTKDNLVSTVIGLGTAGYLSSASGSINVSGLVSTANLSGLVSTANLSNLVSTTYLNSQINSTVIGLGTSGYISSFSSLVKYFSTGYILAGLTQTSTVNIIDLYNGEPKILNSSNNALYFNGTLVGSGTLINNYNTSTFIYQVSSVSTVYTQGVAYISSATNVILSNSSSIKISTGTVFASSFIFIDGTLNTLQYLNVNNGTLSLNGLGFLAGNVSVVSTANLAGLVSTANLVNLVSTANLAGFVSTANLSNLVSTSFLNTSLTSTIIGLGSAGYLSTLPSIGGFVSTANLAGLVSTANLARLVSTANLANLVSTANLSNLVSTSFLNTSLTSTVIGLGSAGYLSTLPSIGGFVSTANLAGLVSTANLSRLVSTANLSRLVSTANLSDLVSTSFLATSLSSISTSYANYFTTSSFIVSSILGHTATISSLNVDSIQIGNGLGWLNIGPIQTIALSTQQVQTGILYATNISTALLNGRPPVSFTSTIFFKGQSGDISGTPAEDLSTNTFSAAFWSADIYFDTFSTYITSTTKLAFDFNYTVTLDHWQYLDVPGSSNVNSNDTLFRMSTILLYPEDNIGNYELAYSIQDKFVGQPVSTSRNVYLSNVFWRNQHFQLNTICTIRSYLAPIRLLHFIDSFYKVYENGTTYSSGFASYDLNILANSTNAVTISIQN